MLPWKESFGVLILVLMEYGLRGLQVREHSVSCFRVLILVLMEYGLRVISILSTTGRIEFSLNPCFNGIWSASDASNTSDLKSNAS